MWEPCQNDINTNLWLTFMCEGGGGGGNGIEIGSVHEGLLCPNILSFRGMVLASYWCHSVCRRLLVGFYIVVVSRRQ